MNATTTPDRSAIDWAIAGAALEGGRSGDVQVVAPFNGGVLLAVIDGLGHGHEAAIAAEAAAETLTLHPEAPLPELVERCHERLRKTRGAVMTLASIDSRRSTLAWGGIGNVEGVLLRGRHAPGHAREAAPTRGGVVGYRIPPLKVSELSLVYGDLLVLASDGIRSGFTGSLDVLGTPQDVANAVFAQHARASDDAMVLVARYLGELP